MIYVIATVCLTQILESPCTAHKLQLLDYIRIPGLSLELPLTCPLFFHELLIDRTFCKLA